MGSSATNHSHCRTTGTPTPIMNHRGSAVPFQKSSHHGKATDGVLGSMDSVCALFYVFYWVFPRAKSKHTKSKRRGRKDSFLSFDDANKFVQLLTTLSTTIHGNHSGEILALRGGSLGCSPRIGGFVRLSAWRAQGALSTS